MFYSLFYFLLPWWFLGGIYFFSFRGAKFYRYFSCCINQLVIFIHPYCHIPCNTFKCVVTNLSFFYSFYSFLFSLEVITHFFSVCFTLDCSLSISYFILLISSRFLAINSSSLLILFWFSLWMSFLSCVSQSKSSTVILHSCTLYYQSLQKNFHILIHFQVAQKQWFVLLFS